MLTHYGRLHGDETHETMGTCTHSGIAGSHDAWESAYAWLRHERRRLMRESVSLMRTDES